MSKKKTILLQIVKHAVKIEGGLYVNPGDYNQPIPWCTTIAYQPTFRRKG